MTETDSIESLIYLLVHMHTGLPWAGKDDVSGRDYGIDTLPIPEQ